DRAAARSCLRPGGAELYQADDPGAADPLGELLALGRDELQLAAAARARAGARLRRLARGLPPAGDGPLASLLGDGRPSLPGVSGAAALAAPPRLNPDPLARAAAPDTPSHACAARSAAAGSVPSRPRSSRRRARRSRP